MILLPSRFLAGTLALAALHAGAAAPAAAPAPTCQATSGAQRVPVLELYTSEGCSSCPPADRWLSGLKQAARDGKVVAQAFHVGYWDSLGWVDRFAKPAYTQRQRDLAALHGARTVYTPQLVRDAQDWRDYDRALAGASQPAGARIRLVRTDTDTVEARVEPVAEGASWSAYWTVTEHEHASRVRAGENKGETLRHDFVVRQYVPVAASRGAQTLRLRMVPPEGSHPRQVNLVVVEPRTQRPLQALSLAC